MYWKFADYADYCHRLHMHASMKVSGLDVPQFFRNLNSECYKNPDPDMYWNAPFHRKLKIDYLKKVDINEQQWDASEFFLLGRNTLFYAGRLSNTAKIQSDLERLQEEENFKTHEKEMLGPVIKAYLKYKMWNDP